MRHRFLAPKTGSTGKPQMTQIRVHRQLTSLQHNMPPTSPKSASAAEAQKIAPIHNTRPESSTHSQKIGKTHTKDSPSFLVSGHGEAFQPYESEHKTMEIVYIGYPYPPCVRGLRDLEPIVLADLGLNHHHRGQLLLLKLGGVVEASRTIKVVNVEDINGKIELLSVNLAFMDTSFAHNWPTVGSWVVVKEPFFTIAEDSRVSCIRIDHPSDFVDVQKASLHLLGYEFLATLCPEDKKRTPLSCKEAGNAALLANDFEKALVSYTEGLLLSAGETGNVSRLTEQDLFRNRAHVRLTLGYFEGATTDAMAAVTNISDVRYKRLDAKAYFRAASASYKLKHFDLVERYLQAQLDLTPGDKDGQALMKRNEDRLREQQQGRYHISAIEESIPRQPRIDVADYIVNTKIGISRGRGRGLIATRDLELGELVLAETAFCCVFGHDQAYQMYPQCNAQEPKVLQHGNVGLWRETLTKVTRNPMRGRELLHLHSDYKGTEARTSEIDGLLMTDSYRIRDIVAHNAFGVSGVKEGDDETAERQGSGVWIRASYMNHSCVPNTTRIFHGDMMMLHVTRPIKKGEEITGSYMGFEWTRHDGRAKVIECTWGFRCDCPLCVADSRCDRLVRQQRVSLSRTLDQDQLLSIHNPISVPKLEVYTRAITDTYATELYAGLPKVALLPWLSTLVYAYCVIGDSSKCFAKLVEALHALGLEVDTEGERIVKISPTANSILPRFVDDLRGPVLEHAILAHHAGQADVAEHLSQFARSLERIDRGTNEDTLRVYNE